MGLAVDCEMAGMHVEIKLSLYNRQGKGLVPCGAMVMKTQGYERRNKNHISHEQKYQSQGTKLRFPNTSPAVFTFPRSPEAYDKRKGA